MHKIEKIEPKFFTKAKRKVKKPKEDSAWKDENIVEIKTQLREYLIKEQYGLCAYCERKLEDKGDLSIDHFKKRELFPNLTLEYYNFFISCKSKNHCESFKDNKFKTLKKEDYAKIIHPYSDEPEYYLSYNFMGEMVPNDNLKDFEIEKANFTIKIFNLNDRVLIEDRKRIIISLIELLNYYGTWEEIRKSGFDFHFSLLKWIFKSKDKIKGIK